MAFSIKKLIGVSSSNAEVVDNHLVLSFPDAIDPIVWRMSLDKIGTASFEVKQDSNSEQTKLLLKPKKGTAEIIAPFATKKEAIEALMIASKALQYRGNTQNNKINDLSNNYKSSNSGSNSTSSEKQKWGIALVGALIVIGLYYYLMSLIPTTIEDFTPSSSTTTTSPPTEATGVPVNADDFLGSF